MQVIRSVLVFVVTNIVNCAIRAVLCCLEKKLIKL